MAGKVETEQEGAASVRLQTTITELTEDQWALVQRQVKTGYDFPPGASRVCVTFEQGELERHAEMPLSSHIGLLAALGMAGVVRDLRDALTVAGEDAKKIQTHIRNGRTD